MLISKRQKMTTKGKKKNQNLIIINQRRRIERREPLRALRRAPLRTLRRPPLRALRRRPYVKQQDKREFSVPTNGPLPAVPPGKIPGPTSPGYAPSMGNVRISGGDGLAIPLSESEWVPKPYNGPPRVGYAALFTIDD